MTSSSTGTGRGDVLAQTIQNGAGTVSYNIDQAGRDNQIGVLSLGGTTPLTTTLAFNNNEQMTAMALPNGVEQDAQYDAANRLSSLTAQNTANQALLNTSYQYGYDPLGLTSGITTTVQGSPSSQSLTHDAAGRLTAVSGAAPTGSWSYDGRGNLTSATSNGTTTSYSYAAGNPEAVTSTSVSGQPTTSYAYDGAGDTTAITNTSTLNRQLGYDAQARLVQVTMGSPITQTVTLAYNAFGQRAGYSVTPTGAGQPSLAESFKYQGDQLAHVAYAYAGDDPVDYADKNGMAPASIMIWETNGVGGRMWVNYYDMSPAGQVSWAGFANVQATLAANAAAAASTNSVPSSQGPGQSLVLYPPQGSPSSGSQIENSSGACGEDRPEGDIVLPLPGGTSCRGGSGTSGTVVLVRFEPAEGTLGIESHAVILVTNGNRVMFQADGVRSDVCPLFGRVLAGCIVGRPAQAQSLSHLQKELGYPGFDLTTTSTLTSVEEMLNQLADITNVLPFIYGSHSSSNTYAFTAMHMLGFPTLPSVNALLGAGIVATGWGELLPQVH